MKTLKRVAQTNSTDIAVTYWSIALTVATFIDKLF